MLVFRLISILTMFIFNIKRGEDETLKIQLLAEIENTINANIDG